MRRMSSVLIVVMLLAAAGCREEGTFEKAGRQMDEAIEDIREDAEEHLDEAGRAIDESVEEARKKAAR